MGKAQVTIEGVGIGILFHSPSVSMFRAKTSKKVIPTPEDEARDSCYWNEDHTEIGFPSWNIHQALVRAASGLKLPSNKKISLGAIIAGDLSIDPVLIGLGTAEYKIDRRRVVIQRQGIIRSRAWLPTWKMKFTVAWENSTLENDFDQVLLPELLTICGERIGIGDFRPICKGPFGKFKIVEIKKI